jgi:hypothetical protein
LIRHRQAALVFAATLGFIAAEASAQVGTAVVNTPASISFAVTNVNATTTGTPNPAHVSFNTTILVTGQSLHFSLQADATNFTPPGAGGTIAASKVSWTTSNPIGGSAFNGTLSASTLVLVYQSSAYGALPISGSFDIRFALAAPGTSIRAGAHTLTIHWRVEAI